jgi:TolB protein
MNSESLAGHELLVVSTRTGETEVFRVNPGTGDARNLSRHPGSNERYAAWSPDGSLVSFTSDRDGAYNLYVMDADGGNVRQLTHEVPPMIAGMQSWTADGRWIYFGLFGRAEPLMCRIAPHGGDPEAVGTGIDPAVSPDGKTLAFARALGVGHCLFRTDADGGNLRQLTTRENRFAGVHCTWTPDGSAILYSDQCGESLELFRCDPEGGNATQLTAFGNGTASTSAAVSPDMRWISLRVSAEIFWRDAAASERAYREKRADLRPVWVMGIDGANPRLVEALHYQVSIDGSRACWRPPA